MPEELHVRITSDDVEAAWAAWERALVAEEPAQRCRMLFLDVRRLRRTQARQAWEALARDLGLNLEEPATREAQPSASGTA